MDAPRSRGSSMAKRGSLSQTWASGAAALARGCSGWTETPQSTRTLPTSGNVLWSPGHPVGGDCALGITPHHREPLPSSPLSTKHVRASVTQPLASRQNFSPPPPASSHPTLTVATVSSRPPVPRPVASRDQQPARPDLGNLCGLPSSFHRLLGGRGLLVRVVGVLIVGVLVVIGLAFPFSVWVLQEMGRVRKRGHWGTSLLSSPRSGLGRDAGTPESQARLQDAPCAA